MTKTEISKGFSLVEILVSLFLVSMAAVDITGLQQMVSGQNRDNFVYSAVLKLATEKIEEVLQYDLLANLEALDDLTETIKEAQTDTALNLQWDIAVADAVYDAGADLRNVNLQIAWKNFKGEQQTFIYSEQVNLTQLLNPTGGGPATAEAAIIESFLETNEVIYFEPKMGYKKGAFVIYNSELFEATEPISVGNGHPRNVADPDADDYNGWKSYGSIDNPALADNPDLATLFLDPEATTEVASL